MATRGRQKQNASLSKKELEKLEKEAEKKSAERQAANKEKSKEEMRKRSGRVTRRQGQARRKIPSTVREMMISKTEDDKNKKAEQKKPTRREAVQKRRSQASKTKPTRRQATKARRNLRDAGLRTEDRRTTSTSKPKTSASKLAKLARGAKALSVAGLALNVANVGAGSDIVPSKQTARGKKQVPAGRMSTPKPAGSAGSSNATGRSDRTLVAKAKAYKKTGEEKYRHGVSGGGVPFKEAFKYWKGKGAKTFTWNGKKYSTETK